MAVKKIYIIGGGKTFNTLEEVIAYAQNNGMWISDMDTEIGKTKSISKVTLRKL